MTKTKIIIPQQVADAIEKLKEVYTNFGIVQAMESRNSIHPEAVGILNIWTHDEEDDGRNADRLLDVLVNGWEVEPEPLKIGDWATRKKSRRVIGRRSDHGGVAFRIEKVTGDLVRGADGNNHALDALRHATPEEITEGKVRQKWAEIGREVGEIREGDIGEVNTGKLIFSKSEIEAAYSHGALKGLFPIERFVCFWGDADV